MPGGSNQAFSPFSTSRKESSRHFEKSGFPDTKPDAKDLDPSRRLIGKLQAELQKVIEMPGGINFVRARNSAWTLTQCDVVSRQRRQSHEADAIVAILWPRLLRS
jgi:hypothetical protein